jgi:hypothetical protein
MEIGESFIVIVGTLAFAILLSREHPNSAGLID